MFGAIGGELIMEVASMNGIYTQLSLELTPPEFTLPEHYFQDLHVGYQYIAEYTGHERKSYQTVYHPGFDRLRNHLEHKGYIDVQRSIHNADRVLKRFRLNGHWFEEGDKFYCPGAMRSTLKLGYNYDLRIKQIPTENYNDDKNYYVDIPDYLMEKVKSLFNPNAKTEKIVDEKTENITWRIYTNE